LTLIKPGFNFATTPRSIPVSSFIANIEKGIFNLPQNSKATICASVVSILKNSKPETVSNVLKQHLTAIKNLKKDSSIIIIPADKGKAVVLMNREDYKEKISSLLNDENTYNKITDKRRNPTSQVEKDLNKLLSEIKSSPSNHDQNLHQIDVELYHHLHSTDATPATFYALPKIHKADIPLRPTTSCIISPTYNLSKHLVSVLTPLLNERYSVNNSTEFAQEIRNRQMSFNVVSLVTSIPVELALRVTNERL